MSAHADGFAQGFDKAKYFRARLAKRAQATTHIAGNDFYEVIVEDLVGAGVGLYSVRTGPRHPVTLHLTPDAPKKQDLLAGASRGLTGTSYTTVRSYKHNRDYVQTEFAQSEGEYHSYLLDNTFTNGDSVVPQGRFIEPILKDGKPTGFRVLYHLPASQGLYEQSSALLPPDSLDITQIVNVHGESFNDSWVEITTIVENTGSTPTTIGIRYLWDLNIADDDGPILRQRGGDPFGLEEFALAPVDFAFYEAEANDNIAAPPPAYQIYGSALTPTTMLRTSLQPVRIQQVFWPLAFFKAFDYEITPGLNVVGGGNDPLSQLTGGDNAVQYFWGDTPQKAITLWPGQTATVTQGLFSNLPNDAPCGVLDCTPPSCEVLSITPGPPKTIQVAVQDSESGLAAIRLRESSNVQVDIPDFDTGTIAPVQVNGISLNQAQPFHFTITLRDLVGNSCECDPILLTLQPDLNITEYRFEPAATDRYLYLKNQGLEEIAVDLNAVHFVLRGLNVQGENVFKMPLAGEMTIDISRYLLADHNVMTMTFSGPPRSRADVVLADANIKSGVDLVLDLASNLPRQFALAQNLPNPFRGRTAIRFDLPASSRNTEYVRLKVYNMLGQLVRTLVDGNLPAHESHTVAWDGRDDAGREVAAGIYVYRLHSAGLELTKKMALLR